LTNNIQDQSILYPKKNLLNPREDYPTVILSDYPEHVMAIFLCRASGLNALKKGLKTMRKLFERPPGQIIIWEVICADPTGSDPGKLFGTLDIAESED